MAYISTMCNPAFGKVTGHSAPFPFGPQVVFDPIPYWSGCFGLGFLPDFRGEQVVLAQFWRVVSAHFIEFLGNEQFFWLA